MRILFLCEAEHGGGAMRSAWRQLTALRQLGHEVGMLARQPLGDDPGVIGPRSSAGRLWARVRRRLDGLPLRGYPARGPGFFSPAWLPDRIGPQIERWRPDVVHVHWINNGFISLGTLGSIRAPQIWSLHDSWAFTGGCHYGECQRFTAACGACPALGSHAEDDLSRRVMQRKRAAWQSIAPRLVAPSGWMAGRAAASSLCGRWPISVIPNPIDHAIYAPADRHEARRRLGLPAERKLVLFSALHADDRNKGLDLLRPALRRLAGVVPSAMLVSIGHPPSGGFGDIGMPVQALGPLVEEAAVAAVTGAVDAVAVPSRSESFSFGVLEAQACGAVPVAFRVGGIPDRIEHQRTGWLAEPFDDHDFAAGLAWALSAQAPSAPTLVAATAGCALQQVAAAHLAVYKAAPSNGSSNRPAL